jgi:hypothetical protein
MSARLNTITRGWCFVSFPFSPDSQSHIDSNSVSLLGNVDYLKVILDSINIFFVLPLPYETEKTTPFQPLNR